MVVHHEAGTTMDSVVNEWEYRGRRVKLIDTCGIYKGFRAGLTDPETDKSLDPGMGTKKAVRRSHIVVLCLDAHAFRDNPYSCPSHFELMLAK